MKAAIFNPYLDTLGGGERYTMAFASVLAKLGHKVEVEWKDEALKTSLEERFGIDLKNIDFVPDVKRGDGYDLCFWVSDGSIPLLYSRKNILHFQVPFTKVGGRSLLNKMKLFRVDSIICNSNFTKKVIDVEYGVNSTVVYPPVAIEKIKPGRKENTILSVGRFSQLKQAKRQDVLIEAFKKLFDMGVKDHRLIMAGGTEVGAADYVEQLKSAIGNYPIDIIESPPFSVIKNLYAKAKIYWTAAGFDMDEEKNPEQVEHFGMALVEAMAGGCGVFAYNAGGHKEIIQNNENGYLWNDTQELAEKSFKVIKDNNNFKTVIKKSRETNKLYSEEVFSQKVIQIING